jgi:lipoate-protein ligase A
MQPANPDDPAAEMDAAARLLADVAAGRRGPVARVFRPAPTVAFGRLDELREGYEEARRRAVDAGYTPVRRLAGGRAAAYHRGSVVLELFTLQSSIAAGIERRFNQVTELIAATLADQGLAVGIGELPGEFCPGRFSVHANGVKLAGVAQRSIRGAALVAAFVSVERGAELRQVLTAVYDALELDWDPGTAGAAEDLLPGLTAADVAAALEDRLAAPFR